MLCHAGALISELADRVGHKDATMIVKVYSHLVDEIRTKKAFTIPDLTKKVDQTKKWLVK